MSGISVEGNSYFLGAGDMPPGVYVDLFMEACLRLCGKRSMDYNEVDEKQPHLPKGASVPRNQVAGHKHEGRSKLGLLEHEDGTILKALQKPPRGTRELDFYRKIFDEDCADKDILQLQQLLPQFYGSFQFDEYPDVTYLKLENLVRKFKKPCVVDIKMGKKTYDPEAGPAKIAKEMTKFPHVEKFGFQFTGMQTYDPVEQRIKFYDKFFCRKLGENELLTKGLGTYFSIKHGLRKDAIKVLIEKLKEIEKWFETQRRFSFYASSLLMIYEGDTQQNDYYTPCNQCHTGDCMCSMADSEQTDSTDQSDNASSRGTENTDLTSSETVLSEMDTASSSRTDNSSLTASVSNISVDTQSTSGNPGVNNHNAILAEVRMIDFTHVFNVEEQDDNYLYGLKNLISNMQQLLDS
ncbi:inositol polyphosphate multikinase-like isoform X1 [Ruditapes philippinarum]|uniref:inositol polyphosphate multikinase-like isoform X1 n=2 Tax=Ruditapes philippinarum TaxID=129788 RepID=UPI00295C2896|nr:inositol polyphosphate multikinase-like isoform X1 [Ruditapes philippinarum]